MLRLKWGFLIGIVAVAGITGCSPEGAERPKTVKVTGTVTYNGTPVADAVVKFSPQGEGHAASGTTDASGKYSLTSFESGDGAVPGSYQVGISKIEGAAPAAGGGGGTSEADIDAAYKAAEQAGQNVMGSGTAAAAPEAKDLLPAKYKDPASSGLEAKVAEGGSNNFDFPLED